MAKKSVTIGGKKVTRKIRKKKTPSPEKASKEPELRNPSKVTVTKRTAGPKSIEAKLRDRQISQKHKAKVEFREAANIRDIYLVPPHSSFKPLDLKGINWERRKACKADPLLDLQTYMPKVFYLGWADFHRALIGEIEDRIKFGGKKAFGMPRASGKTAISRGMILRATKYGLRKFPFFIGSKEDKAVQTLRFIQSFWYRSVQLQQDFPEIAYSIYRIEGRSTAGMHGQTYRGQRTHLVFSSKEMQYPTLLFDEEEIAGYLEHEPESVIYLPDIGVDMPYFTLKSAGCLIRVAGIDGSIRGEADIHPILLTQPRPDFILLDDVQKDQKADSPKACQDLETLIESAIDHLSAPDVNAATLMPCTVIREGDVSDTYLDPAKKSDYVGSRYGVISRYPDGITDEVIHDEVGGAPNEQGKAWNEYREVRESSMRQFGDLRLANQFYREHQNLLEDGFEVTWDKRYKQDTGDPTKDEVSAIQSAMNWRFKDHASFMSEAQNRPKSSTTSVGLVLTVAEVAEKITNIPKNEISQQWNNIVAFIDIQEEIFFYSIFAFDHAFNGQFIDYGTFPHVNSSYIRKNQTYGWSLLTREYYKARPQNRPSGINRNKGTYHKAPFDEKIYLALSQCCRWLLSRRFPLNDQHQQEVGIRALGIDTKWGKASEVCKRFIREFNDQRVIAFQGHPFMPSNKQLEEYTSEAGWLFEHEQFPHVKESKWVIKPYRGNESARYVLSDVNRWKTFLMKRFATPPGAAGSISLFEESPEFHKMFATHIAQSEFPESILARGMSKDCWKSKPGMEGENDFLDCAVGCLCLASICGASLKSPEIHEEQKQVARRRKNLRDIYNQKKSRR